uniref:Uncharacterized protein n=1 Tax=Cucumis melo TaxID=3656 RepID=A0A9I9EE72_CUCME
MRKSMVEDEKKKSGGARGRGKIFGLSSLLRIVLTAHGCSNNFRFNGFRSRADLLLYGLYLILAAENVVDTVLAPTAAHAVDGNYCHIAAVVIAANSLFPYSIRSEFMLITSPNPVSAERKTERQAFTLSCMSKEERIVADDQEHSKY